MIAASECGPRVSRDNERWRARVLGRLPGPISAAITAHADTLDRIDYRAANRYMGETSVALQAAHLHRAYDEDLIRDYGENYARLCGRSRSLEARRDFALSMGIEPPAGRNLTPSGASARLECPRWWRRQLRKSWTRAAENSMRDLGFIRKGRAPYASDEAVRHRAAQKRRARDFLQSCVAVNEAEEQLDMWDLHERSISNPALRRGEFMCRCRGFEQIAANLGHVAEFATLTAPSAFHAQLADAGRNPNFDSRAVVRAAQEWMCKMWARARAQLKRRSVLIYGFRIAEPHHDATPHWHLLLFVPSHQAETLRTVLAGVWISEFENEPGAREHRTRFETIDPTRGSATGYLAKYVSKNIDGRGSIAEALDHETGAGMAEGIVRVDAWASIHGIRQFQQIGGPPVGLWREARRLRDPVADIDIERARACADRGDWSQFVASVGGIYSGRRTALGLEKVETGESDRYGDFRPARVIGLRYCSSVVITRPHRWRIEKKGACTGATHRESCAPTAQNSSRHSFSPGSIFTWTRVNNCTLTVSAPFVAWSDEFTARERSPPVRTGEDRCGPPVRFGRQR